MKKYKYCTIFLSVLIILSSCQSFSEGMMGSKRSKSGDEFLVHKKKPLVIPPDFDEIPSPKPAKKNERTTISDSSTSIEDLLNIKRENSDKTFESVEDKSLEQSILKKIKKN